MEMKAETLAAGLRRRDALNLVVTLPNGDGT